MSNTALMADPVAGNRRPDVAVGAVLSPPADRTSLTGQWLDWVERVFILGFYGWLVARLLLNYWAGGSVGNLLLLPSEGLVVFFILIRRPTTNVSRRPAEWVLALAVTCSPMLATPGVGRSFVPEALGATVLLMGLLIQVHAKVTLGRSLGCVPAHRGLKLTGPYRFVRHPMYAGYLLSHLAFLAMNPTLANLAVYAFSEGLQIPRLLAEERLLAQDPVYRQYQAAVPYRLIPGVF
jgi:protein-S-isoprenylcysteine O-methyltransferase Ste14